MFDIECKLPDVENKMLKFFDMVDLDKKISKFYGTSFLSQKKRSLNNVQDSCMKIFQIANTTQQWKLKIAVGIG